MTQQTDIHQIGKYLIVEEIGRGGMAIVYKGYDADLERAIAIKVLPEVFTNDPQFIQRFQQEAKMAARLHHPNIVTIHDVGQQGNLYYIVMQYLPGLNLDQVVNANGPLPLKTAAAITLQIAAALDHAHQRGMIHRDVKPSNIMLSPEGQVTLMDFGLVRAGESSAITRMGTVVGTPEYMSPEQAQGHQVDSRTDIYSLGVVLYKMLSGASPYARSTPLATLLAQVTDPLPLDGPIAHLPRDVKRVLQKALAKSPSDRYQSAGALAADLAKVTGVQPGQPVMFKLPAALPRAQVAKEVPSPGMQPTHLMTAGPASPLPPAVQGSSVPAAPLAGQQASGSGPRPVPRDSSGKTTKTRRKTPAIGLAVLALVLVIAAAGFALIRGRDARSHDLPALTPTGAVALLRPEGGTAGPDATPPVVAMAAPSLTPESSEAPLSAETPAPAVPAPTEAAISPTPLIVTVQVVVTATPAPTFTPKPATATSQPSPTPVQPRATVTPKTEAATSGGQLPAPGLSDPADQARYSDGKANKIQLGWQSGASLGTDDYYVVLTRFRAGAETWIDDQWTKDTRALVPDYLLDVATSDRFEWGVVIAREDPAGAILGGSRRRGVSLSQESAHRVFYWSAPGTGAPPTPAD
jgi:eukaryotic-like serine/threonine-protein kinase